MKSARRDGELRTTILLKDLDPGRDVRGGAGKKLFGEQAGVLEALPESGGSDAKKPGAKADKEKR